MFETVENIIVYRLGWTLLHFLWQGVVVGLVAAVLLVALRRIPAYASRARLRYNTLLCLFIVLVACPIATFGLLQPPQQLDQTRTQPSANPMRDTVPVQRHVADIAKIPEVTNEKVPSIDAVESPSEVSSAATSDPAIADTVHRPSEVALAERLQAVLPWIVLTWCFGVVLLTARFARTWWHVRRLVRIEVKPLDTKWVTAIQRLIEQLAIRRTVKFLESGLIHVPVVIGWVKPVVLLPTAVLTNLTTAEVESLIIHELAHIQRRDTFFNLVQAIAETILFYHLVVWILSHRLRIERENCCDDIAIEVIGDRARYSRALFAAAELAIAPSQKLAVASNDGDFVNRIRRVLGQQDESVKQVGWLSMVATLACASMAVFTAVAIWANSSNADTPDLQNTDAIGDGNQKDLQQPLPRGAVLRLGKDQYAVGLDHIRFLPDNKSIVVAVRSTNWFGQHVAEEALPAAIIDAKSGKIIRRIGPAATKENIWSVMGISGDGRRIAYRRGLFSQAWSSWGSATFGRASVVDIDVYDTLTGKLISTLKQARDAGRDCAAMNYDGSRMFICNRRTVTRQASMMEVWNTTQGTRLKSKPVPNRGNIDSVALDHKGEEAAIGCKVELYIWNWSTGETKVVDTHGATAVAFSPDGKHIGTGRGGSPEARLRDRTSGKKLFQFPVGGGSLTVGFSPDGGSYIVPSGYRNEINIFDVKSGNRTRKIITGGIRVQDVAVSPDGELLAATGQYPGIGVWDLTTGKQISQNGSGHDESVRDLRYSPDGKMLVTAGMDGRIVLWDATTGKLKRELLKASRHWAGGVNFSVDGQFVVAATLDGNNYAWKTATGRLVHKRKGHGTTGSTYPIVMNDGKRIVSYGADHDLRVYDVGAGKTESNQHLVLPAAGLENDHPSRISADGSTLVVASQNELIVVDVATGKKKATIPARSVGNAFDVSPDGTQIATTQKLIDAKTGKIIRSIKVNGGRNGDVTFSKDGRWIAILTIGSRSLPGYVRQSHRLWLHDCKTGQTFQNNGPSIHPYAVAPSPDGKHIAVACADNSVLIFESAQFAIVGGYLPPDDKPVVFEFLKSDEKLKRIAGRVVDSNNRPVSGVKILLREMPLGKEIRDSLYGFDKTSDVATVRTDHKGRFEFKDVPSMGEHPRTVHRRDGLRYDIVAIPSTSAVDPEKSLAISWRHVRDGDEVEFKLKNSASLNGQITDLEGIPIANALVAVRFFMAVEDVIHVELQGPAWPNHTADNFLSLRAARRGHVLVQTNKQGHYSLPNLPKDTGVVLEVMHPDFANQFFYAASVEERNPVNGRRRRRKVHVGRANIKLDPGHHVKVRVIYSKTGKPVPGAIVSLYDFRNEGITKTANAAGIVEVATVRTGQFSISAKPPEGKAGKDAKYVSGAKKLFLSRKDREHEVTVMILTRPEIEVDQTIRKFLDRIENVVPDLPPRRPRKYVQDSAGEVVELRLRDKKLLQSDFPIIAKFEFLETMSLQSSNVRNQDLQHLAGLKNLKHLFLDWNQQLGSGLTLKDLPKLESLNLRLTKVVDNDLKFLKNLPKLRSLDLSSTEITDAGLKLLADMKLPLEVLRLGDCQKISDKGLLHLTGLVELRGLTLNETPITDAGLKSFAAQLRVADRPRFDWIVSPLTTVNEIVRRIEAGEHQRMAEMTSPGVTLPTKGNFKSSVTKLHPATEKDLQLNRRKYRIEFKWTHDGRADVLLFAELRVDRGTVSITEAGIR